MAKRSKTLSVVTLAAAAAVALAGCGKSDTGSSTTSEHTTSASSSSSVAPVATLSDQSAAVWDPCTLPDSAISSVGLSTTTKDNTVAGTQFPGWKVCGWRANAGWYDLGILSSSNTLDDIQKRTDYAGFTPTSVGTHHAVQYRDATDPDHLACYITAQVPNGVVTFDALTRYGSPGGGDSCAEVRRISGALARYLPGN